MYKRANKPKALLNKIPNKNKKPICLSPEYYLLEVFQAILQSLN